MPSKAATILNTVIMIGSLGIIVLSVWPWTVTVKEFKRKKQEL